MERPGPRAKDATILKYAEYLGYKGDRARSFLRGWRALDKKSTSKK